MAQQRKLFSFFNKSPGALPKDDLQSSILNGSERNQISSTNINQQRPVKLSGKSNLELSQEEGNLRHGWEHAGSAIYLMFPVIQQETSDHCFSSAVLKKQVVLDLSIISLQHSTYVICYLSLSLLSGTFLTLQKLLSQESCYGISSSHLFWIHKLHLRGHWSLVLSVFRILRLLTLKSVTRSQIPPRGGSSWMHWEFRKDQHKGESGLLHRPNLIGCFPTR